MSFFGVPSSAGLPVGLLGALAVLPAAACRHLEREEPGRPPRVLAELVEPLRPVHPGFDLVLEPEEEGEWFRRYTFRFSTFSEPLGDFKRVEGRYYRSLRVPPGRRGPLILVSPILAGPADDYLTCHVFSRWAAEEGFSAFFLHQEGSILTGRRDGLALDLFFREDVQDNLKALDLFLERPEVDPARLGAFGISLGAMKNVVLTAAEPRLSASVLCLAGADLPDILLHSREGAVRRYVRRRAEAEGLTAEEVAEEIRRNLSTEPAVLAEAIANDRVLLFLGCLDNKVPYANGLLLREKLGKPETYIVPFGHYTGVLAAGYAARRTFDFFDRRFGGESPGAGGAASAP
jgi:dipeptidyl aminopeptidase/acylaminoacyl peptidase